jgi:hypothetical protein
MGNGWHNDAMGSGWWVPMVVGMLVFLTVFVIGAVLLVRHSSQPPSGPEDRARASTSSSSGSHAVRSPRRSTHAPWHCSEASHEPPVGNVDGGDRRDRPSGSFRATRFQ